MQKIFDSELKLMELIWEREPVSAKDLSLLAATALEWNKNTTYTVLKKLEAKGFILRKDPGFICSSLVTRDEVQKSEAKSLAARLFGGSKRALFSALLEDEDLTADDIAELKDMINKR